MKGTFNVRDLQKSSSIATPVWPLDGSTSLAESTRLEAHTGIRLQCHPNTKPNAIAQPSSHLKFVNADSRATTHVIADATGANMVLQATPM